MEKVVNSAVCRNIVLFALTEVDRNAVEIRTEIIYMISLDLFKALAYGIVKTGNADALIVLL